MKENVTFVSQGLKISGFVTVPEGHKAGDKHPAFLVLHGFGSNKNAGNVQILCAQLAKMGYVTLGFDMRGCGESEGEKGRIICLDQVEDTKSAVTYMQSRPEVDPDCIGLIGSSFGAAVSVYTAGVDKRVACAISSGGWGDGERKFKGQHRGDAWKKFTDMLAEGKRVRETTGKSLMVPRYDIVPIPPELRGHVVEGSIQMFPAETAQSMFDFRADDVVGNIAPRPLLLLHSSVDSVTPTEQSVEMFKRAGQPTDLHLFAETDHFMFAEGNVRVHSVLNDWLAKYFPATVKK
jgi:dipeptidyl aminopeptidase/acylaminoacyl peptidase